MQPPSSSSLSYPHRHNNFDPDSPTLPLFEGAQGALAAEFNPDHCKLASRRRGNAGIGVGFRFRGGFRVRGRWRGDGGVELPAGD